LLGASHGESGRSCGRPGFIRLSGEELKPLLKLLDKAKIKTPARHAGESVVIAVWLGEGTNASI